jgi:hypothetical protein
MCIAAAIAGAAVVGAGATIYAGNKAAGAQQDAAKQAANTQLGMYGQTRQDLSGYAGAGNEATSALKAFYGLPGGVGPDAAHLSNTLSNLPGYQFMQGQGVQALDRSAASKGLLNSGAQGKALTQYGQNYAMSNALSPYLGGLQNLSAQGESAAAQTGYAGTAAAGGAAGAQMAGGQAAAGGYINSANAINYGMGQGAGLYGLYQGGYFNQQKPGYTPQDYGAAPAGWGQTGNLNYQQQVAAGF